MKDPSDDGDFKGEPQAKRRREESLGNAGAAQQPSSIRPQQEIGAAVTNRTVRTAESNHVMIMSPPNEQQTPTKTGCEEVMIVPGRESGARTHTKFRESHQKDYQCLSLNGAEGAKDVMILSLQKRLNTSSTEVKLSGQQMIDQRNKSPSHFEDNKRHVESLSSMNKDHLHSTKKNLFIQEFQLDDQLNKNAHESQGGNNRIITLTAENMEVQTPREALPTPVTSEQKLRRYLSLKLSADFRDLLTMSGSPGQTSISTQIKQTLVGKHQVFSLFSAERCGSIVDHKNILESHRDVTGPAGDMRLANRDFICLPDFGENTLVGQLRDADSILDSLFS